MSLRSSGLRWLRWLSEAPDVAALIRATQLAVAIARPGDSSSAGFDSPGAADRHLAEADRRQAAQDERRQEQRQRAKHLALEVGANQAGEASQQADRHADEQ